MRIGLSYDQGTPKYRFYVERLLEAAGRYGFTVEPVWLAGSAQPLESGNLSRIDGLVLTGGADIEPHRYGAGAQAGLCKTLAGRDDAELEVLEAALDRDIPMLAICRGLQLLNVYQGGTLIPDLGPAHTLKDDTRHPVEIAPGSTLRSYVKVARGLATSSHHQAIDRLGNELRVAARHEDGTIEAVEWAGATRRWLVAVQWHPERMSLVEPLSGRLYEGFLAAIRDRST